MVASVDTGGPAWLLRVVGWVWGEGAVGGELGREGVEWLVFWLKIGWGFGRIWPLNGGSGLELSLFFVDWLESCLDGGEVICVRFFCWR